MNENLEVLIEEHAAETADMMVKVVEWAGSEEDIRHECNKLIDRFIEDADLEVKGRHEYGLAGGRIDSKYGGVVIEYKYPKGAGKITEDRNAPGVKAVVKQIKKRFRDLEREENVGMDRIFGVGCDGDTFVFVRVRGSKFDVEDPQPVTPHTVQRLLRALVSVGARGLSFTPENLTAHFGSDSQSAREGVRLMQSLIHDTKNPKAQTFFRQWQILFGEVCGYDIHNQSAKVEKLADHYGVADCDPAELLFAVHTYYAIFMKMLAAEIVASFSPIGTSTLKKLVSAATSTKLHDEMRNLEQGGIWSQLGIRNFLEGDLFSWYLDAWNEDCATAVRAMTQSFDKFDPTTLSVDPAESRDLLKQLYQQLFPQSVRHDLGEYYTPDWLAELVLDEIGYDGDPDKRLLDPACGSGTFLVMALNRVKRWYGDHRHECGFGEDALLEKILRNIIGFDLNPLAVMAARTNYLLAIRDLLQHAGSIELPVYLCDSIMTPSEYGEMYSGGGDLFTEGYGKGRRLATSVGDFIIPNEITESRDLIGKYTDTLEFCIANRYSAREFLDRCEAQAIPSTEAELHQILYNQLQKVDDERKNGIWARIIKNAFAPLFVNKFDFVADNPPWVNWRNLPPEYRQSISPIWVQYGLFTHQGLEARLGAGMDDLSVLMLFVAADIYLKSSGKLSFVITQTIFKSAGGGKGFRKLELGSEKYLNVKRVLDFSKAQVFEGATNRTAVVTVSCAKKPNKYPVAYQMYMPKGVRRIKSDIELGDVKKLFSVRKLEAMPISAEHGSSWITLPKGLSTVLDGVRGQSDYRGRIGVHSGGASGVFWVEVIDEHGVNLIIRNLHDAGRNKFDEVTQAIESEFVRPLIRGRDLQRWSFTPSAHIVIPYRETNSGKAVSIAELKTEYPLTYQYFRQFKDKMIERPHYRQHFQSGGQPYYSMYNVGDYTFSPYRIAWREQSSQFQSCVISADAHITSVAEHKLIVVPVESADEAFFLTGCLNSSPVRLIVDSYSIQVQISTHVLKHVAVPNYNGSDLHSKIADLSRKAHKLAAEGRDSDIPAVEAKIDEATLSLWGITRVGLKKIQKEIEAP